MKAWLKGGISGLIVGFIFSILCELTCDGLGCVTCALPAIFLFAYPLSWIRSWMINQPYNLVSFVIYPILNMIGLAIIGAIIGWMVGKIKSIKQ